MVTNTDVEVEIKQILVKELEYIAKVGSSKLAHQLQQFFESFRLTPIAYLFSKEGMNDVKKYITNSPIKSDIIEFLYRIRTAVSEHSYIYTKINKMLSKDEILSNVISVEVTPIEYKSDTDLEKYYVLILIYIYNNVVVRTLVSKTTVIKTKEKGK